MLSVLLFAGCGDDSPSAEDMGAARDAGPVRDAAGDGDVDRDAAPEADGGAEDAGPEMTHANTTDSGPPVSCDAPGNLSSARLGGVDLELEIPRDGSTDPCAEAAAGESIDGALYYRVDVEPGEGVQFRGLGIVATERADCDSGCGTRVDGSFSFGGFGDSVVLNTGESVVSFEVVIGGLAGLASRRRATVRFNSITDNLTCESARAVTAPALLEDQNTVAASERYSVRCPGAPTIITPGSFFRVSVPGGSTLVADADGDYAEVADAASIGSIPTTLILGSCPAADRVLTCIGEERGAVGPWTYTNSSDAPEEVIVFATTGRFPRVDVSLQLE